MAFSSRLKGSINSVLALANLRIETLTAEKTEAERIQRQIAIGQFDKPAYPLLDGMEDFDGAWLGEAYVKYRTDLDRMLGGAPPAKYDRDNGFYATPDAEILYLMVRALEPKRIVEIGSGNSTRIIRQAIVDGRLDVHHLAIDPEPRTDIAGFTTRVVRHRFEETDAADEIANLGPNDILFIDSSHEVHVANDVTKLFCNAIPSLKSGVAVHVHDIFLPFDYPEPFNTSYPWWGEQYLLQVMLAEGRREILWPGYYLQRSRPGMRDVFPFLARGRAQSFWFRT
jgi:hypothetical protein